MLNLELEAEEEPEDPNVFYIENDDDVMLYDTIAPGEEVVVFGEFDLSSCDLIEIESMEVEETQTPPVQPAQTPDEPSSQQQIIVRHTKKGKQILMVKQDEEGKDKKRVVYRPDKDTPKEDADKAKDDSSTEKEPQPGPSRAITSATPIRPSVPRAQTPVIPQSSASLVSAISNSSSTSPTVPARPLSAPARTVSSPTISSPPARFAVSPTTNAGTLLSRLVSVPVPTQTVPSPSITPPPGRVVTSPSVSSSPVRFMNVPAARLVNPMTVRHLTAANVASANLRLVTSPNRLVTTSIATSSTTQPQVRFITTQTVPGSTVRLVNVSSPSRFVTVASLNNQIRPITTISNRPPIVSPPNNNPKLNVSVPLTTPSSRLTNTPETTTATTTVAQTTTVATTAVVTEIKEQTVSAEDTPSVVSSSKGEPTASSDANPTVPIKTEDNKSVVIPTLPFPDFPEGLASKFMSAECSVIKKSEVHEPTPIRAAKTYEKSRHGKPKIQLTEHDYTTSQKPIKMEVDETDISSQMAKIDPKVRDVISISKITTDAKKIDRRKSMETLSKRKGIDERRRSSENKRELEQRRLMILEEIKQEKTITETNVGPKPSQSAPSPAPTVPPPIPIPSDMNIKSEQDLSDVIDILENIDSTAPTRLLSTSEIQSIEKTPLFENDELDKSPVKPKPDEKINIQSLLNESGESDLQMSDLARGTPKPVAVEPRNRPPPPSNHSKLAALLTGGKVPTLEALLDKEPEEEQKKVETPVEIKTEPHLLLSPTSGILRQASATPVSTPPTQTPADRVAEIQKELMSQPEDSKPTVAVLMTARAMTPQTMPSPSPIQYNQSTQVNPPMTYQQAMQQSPVLTQQSPMHQQQQFNFPQMNQSVPMVQDQFQHQMSQQQQMMAQPRQMMLDQQQQHLTMGPGPQRFQIISTNNLTRLSVPSAVMTTSVHPSRMDESQNVLLKQLLQNTGCAGGASSPGVPRSPTPSTPSPITSPTIKKEPMDPVDIKQESLEELKKLKRRQYQQKRRQSQGKEGSTPKKRARKGSRMEEDYESYTEGLMNQLKTMPPLPVMEPTLARNFGVCPAFGSGENSLPSDDFYNTKPFGEDEKPSTPSPISTQRGFYDQVS